MTKLPPVALVIARYIVTTDADGQYNPREIESLLMPVVSSLTGQKIS